MSEMRHCDFKPCEKMKPIDHVVVYGGDAWYQLEQEGGQYPRHFCSALHLAAYMVLENRVDDRLLAKIIEDYAHH